MKRIVACFILMGFIVSNIFSLVATTKIFAETIGTEKTVLLNEEAITVTMERAISETQIDWVMHYDVTSTEGNRKLKVAMFEDERVLSMPTHESWEQTENWFVEKDFSEKSKGTLHFSTLSIEELVVHIQVDEEKKDEEDVIVIQDSLPSDLEGPHRIKLAQQESEESTTETVDSEEVVSSTIESKTIESMDEEPVPHDVLYPRFTPSYDVANVSNYQDPFSYEEDPVFGGQVPSIRTKEFLKDFVQGEVDRNKEHTTRNFSYGESKSNYPPTINVTEGTKNFYNGYHFYQNPNSENPLNSVLTKQSVRPTANPYQFDMKIDIIGGKELPPKPIDIIFVVDKSASMNNIIAGVNKTRWDVLKESLDLFSHQLLKPENDIQMGIVAFGSTWSGRSTSDVWAESSKFGTSEFTSDPNQLMNSSVVNTSRTPNGSGTPTYLGVELGTKILTEDARPEAEKYLIVLTDGLTTFYPRNNRGINQATKSSAQGKDVYKLTTNNFSGTGTEQGANPRNSLAGTLNYLRDFVYTDAKYPNYAKMNRYGIGFGVSGADIDNLLAAIGPDGQYSAHDNDSLGRALDRVRRNITGTSEAFDSGSLINPISPFVELVGGEKEITIDALSLQTTSPKELQVVSSTDTKFPDYAHQIKDSLTLEENAIKLSDMYLSADDEQRFGIRITYTVELKPEYRDGKFYPTNGATGAVADNFKQGVGFAVPSVRVESFDLPVEKIWQDQDNTWQTRSDIVLTLEQYVDDKWQAVTDKQVILTKEMTGEQLKHVFEQLAKKDSRGELAQYRLVETTKDGKSRVYGYENPDYSHSSITAETKETLQVTNKLLVTDIEFTKTASDDTPLAGTKFVLESSLKERQEAIADKQGYVRFENLPVGSYQLVETQPLPGYEKIAPIPIEIVQNAKGQLMIEGLPKNKQITNHIHPFELIVHKIDQYKQPVEGVSFELTTEDGTLVPQSETQAAKNIFIFEKLTPGTYYLKETKVPDAFIKLTKPITIHISETGEVSIEGKGELKNVVLSESNTIELNVVNRTKGMLPTTGGTSRYLYIICASVFFSAALVLASYLFYRNRKERGL
ncbi:SpaA isopeptide-forming pilin-related protein [Candidatus Enterococcus willemsii]|uniref:VWFA domain-containing protein n=1 Tax=Candidatus Enterococcus willemsii TaxID=1857215 RepID=A0ABQ6YW03_9ENTE|nr:SpaA isopeptide-forming pilin-related protein [Enterococcus sp. CU12B]KAF1301448.1 hypothetical protein BAU17_05860 [Enterococcus sp. CU12B]